MLIVIGGTLLLAPGFITDIVGVLLLIPPTRAIARALLRRFTVGRFTVVGVSGAGGAFGGGPGGRDAQRAPRDYDFDASAEEVPPTDERRLPPTDD